MSGDRETLTWDDFGQAVQALAGQVRDSGFAPDLVLAVARGGLGLGMGLGYALDVKRLATINVEFYTGVDQRLAAPTTLPPTPDPQELAGLRVLVTDDVADTGHTLEHALTFCSGFAREVRTAVVYQKPHSVHLADYHFKATGAWIDFPWSSPAAVGAAAGGSER